MFGQCGQERPAGQPSLSAWAASEAQTCLTAGSRSSARISSMRAASPGLVVLMRTAEPDGAELVIKMQWRQLDGDVGNGGRIGREASTESVEIRQSAGIELAVDGRGEFG